MPLHKKLIIEGRKAIGAMMLGLPASGREVTAQVNCLIPTITGLGQYFVKLNSLVRCIFDKTLHRQVNRPLNIDLMISAEYVYRPFYFWDSFGSTPPPPKYVNNCSIQGG